MEESSIPCAVTPRVVPKISVPFPATNEFVLKPAVVSVESRKSRELTLMNGAVEVEYCLFDSGSLDASVLAK